MRVCAAVVAMLLVSCSGGGSGTPAPLASLTFYESVNGSPAAPIPAQAGLDLPNIGDVGVVTAFEGTQQVAFSLTPSSSCSGIASVSPSLPSMQQSVTALATGECTASARSTDGATGTLYIFALPTP